MSTASPEGRKSRGASKQSSSRSGSSRSSSAGTKGLGEAVQAARKQFAELTGRTPDSVTGARALDDGQGWSVLVDVVELERIPSSTSVLATYRVDLDGDGSITGYERLRRYTRGATDPT
jgi:hypothetical protein